MVSPSEQCERNEKRSLAKRSFEEIKNGLEIFEAQIAEMTEASIEQRLELSEMTSKINKLKQSNTSNVSIKQLTDAWVLLQRRLWDTLDQLRLKRNQMCALPRSKVLKYDSVYIENDCDNCDNCDNQKVFKATLRLEGDANHSVVSIPADNNSTIFGRNDLREASIAIPEEYLMRVSRDHCQIQFNGRGFQIMNIGQNGTFVNGEKITEPCCLKDGDSIQLCLRTPAFIFHVVNVGTCVDSIMRSPQDSPQDLDLAKALEIAYGIEQVNAHGLNITDYFMSLKSKVEENTKALPKPKSVTIEESIDGQGEQSNGSSDSDDSNEGMG
jgi:pSer/pThr/pTyr-binding forkhead associated (FHA) protein